MTNASAGELNPNEVPADDDVTEDDIASGFEAFCDGWSACYRHEMTGLRKEVIGAVDMAPETMRPLFRSMFKVIGLDWLLEFPLYLESYRENGETAFIAWRRIHPRHPTSPNIRP